jgi:hypothetical protein
LQKWASNARRGLVSQNKGTVTATLRNLNKYRFGLMEAIGFKFPRHGVFVEMGVFGGLTKKEAIAQGKLRPQPWFNPVIESRMPDLIDGLAEKTGDLVINAQRILIKNT